MKNNLFRFRIIFLMGFAYLLLSIEARAQETFASQKLPPGETSVGTDYFRLGGTSVDITYTRTNVYEWDRGFSDSGPSHETHLGFYRKIWTAPDGRYIVNAKGKGRDGDILVLLDDGSVWNVSVLGSGSSERIGTFHGPGGEFSSKVTGDALYALTYSSNIYVSRDNAATWQADSAGLSGARIRDFAIDTLEFVYVTTSTGLYKQHPDTSTWRRATSFPTIGPLSSVFVDRRNRIYVGSDSLGPFYSTNSGATWTNATTGIGTAKATSFGDDAYGNIYAINNAGLNVWKLTGGTGSWTRIDQPIANQSPDPAQPNPNGFQIPFFNAVGGDSVLLAATLMGTFASTDQGATWSASNDGMITENAYGYLVLPSGRVLASTSLGTYYRNAADTNWTKTYPTNGYLRGSNIFRDNSGNVYIQGVRLNLNSSTSPKTVWKSTDNGSTWSQDIQGLSSVPQDGTFSVDETGGQHLLYLSGGTANVYSKPPGGSWSSDASGISVSGLFSGGGAFGSDGRGTLFASAGTYIHTGLLWRRATSGGTWSIDTAGIGSNWVTSMTHDRQGNMIVTAYERGFFRRKNGTWSKFALPSQLNGLQTLAVSVDSTGVIYASFYGQDGDSFRGFGVYRSKDDGTTWQSANLDTLQVNSLISFGDSTFALTDRGVYLLRSTSYAQAQLSTKSLSFGNVRVGQVNDITLSISNVGTDTLKISNITSTNAAFSARPTSRTVPPGQSFTDTLRFAPTLLGLVSASVIITSNSSSSPDTIRLSGTGTVLSALAQLNTKILSFGNVRVGQPKDTTMTINNTGSDTLRVTSVTSTSAVFSARPAARTVAPGQSFNDTIRFTPSSAGAVSGNIIITSNSTSSPDTVRVSGTGAAVSAVDRLDGVPTEFSLCQNYPNPFNPSTLIQYSIPTRSRTRLGIYDILGRLVATLVDEEQAPAYYEVQWNASAIPSGVYFYRIEAGNYVGTKKMILLR